MPLGTNKAIGDSKILQRKIPSTGRYNDVKPRVDTGSSMTRYMRKIEDMQTNYRFKNNELFKRIKATTLAQLVLQVANVAMQDDESVADLASPRSTSMTVNGGDAERERLATPDQSVAGDTDQVTETLSPRSTLQTVIKGVGEIEMNSSKNHPVERSEAPYIEKPYQGCPYLILDARDNDEYSACHIIGAKNFPVAMLSRTMNNFTREILDYKNCPGRIIIIYDEDERIATVAATTMVERGFDNIFLLSGGLKVLAQKIPDGIVNGSYPPSCRIYPTKKVARGTVFQMYAGVPPNPKKKRFTAEDLDKINHYMEESLVPQDTGSRLSRLTNASRHPVSSSSKASLTSSSSVSSRRAWR